MEIGIGGYGYTGSSALFSLLQEFSNIKHIDGGEDFEFTLSYISDGLEDLEFHLMESPSKGTRCDIAIYRFLLLIDSLERSYNRFTNGRFKTITEDYLNKLIQVEWKGIRVFEYQSSKWKQIERLIRMSLHILLKKRNIDIRCFPYRNRYLSIFPDDFLNHTKTYVSNILEANGKYDCMLLNQPFSIGDPLRSMRFFKEPKCIVVDRDPRDLYVLCKNVFGTSALFIPTDSVEHFIEYYKKVRDDRKWKDSNLVMRVQFEDLVYKYDSTIDKIKLFLGDVIGNHTNKKKCFNPDFSIKNTNVFNNFPNDKSNIVLIEKELTKWLYNFQDKENSISVSELNSYTFL